MLFNQIQLPGAAAQALMTPAITVEMANPVLSEGYCQNIAPAYQL